MRETYNTVRRSAILDLIKTKDAAFTAKELFDELRDDGKEVALSTIYRALEAFVDAGFVIKSSGADGTVFYLYAKECEKLGHCFLKCRSCGAVKHIDCKLASKLVQHIYEDHHFLVDYENLVLTGLCEYCNDAGDY